MKDSKKQKGTKVKLTKGKRVSLRCPLTVDSTVLEHNYDANCAQICLTVENMGGGGVTDDSVESAIVVIRLFDAQGTMIPCTKNDYFAKLLRFGDEGLKSGTQITFRLTPDCDGGLRVENVELYISRVRYTDGSVTDYLRGDFFDLPGDPIPLHKKHKKHIESITAKFGQTALYEPEALTEIIWRCTCGEFSESDHCSACSASKTELFDFFHEISAPKKAVGAAVAESSDPTADSPSDAPATDATTEYDASSLTGGSLDSADSTDADDTDYPRDEEADAAQHEFRAAPSPTSPHKTDKLKIGLIIAIAASALLLAVIIGLLIFTVVLRSKQSNPSPDSTTGSTTTAATTTEAPTDPTQPVMSDDERIVRSYLESNEFDNALGYARASECSDELIQEILTAAVHYYTEVAPDVDKALQYAEELDDPSSIESLNLQRYNEAMDKGDYQTAISYAELLSQDKDAKISAAAEALVQSQLAVSDFDGALKTVQTYQTTTKIEDITLAAISHYTATHEFDKALALADDAMAPTIAKAAVEYYTEQQNYDLAVEYAVRTGDSADITALIPRFTQPGIKRHLPVFFPYLSFEDKQAVHASVMSTDKVAGIVDVYGNAFWSLDGACRVSETGKTVVSIECTQATTVILFSDGTVAAYGDNSQGQCDVASWRNIVAISASDYHTVGLTADGTVVATGRTGEKQCDVGQYSNVVAIAAGSYHTLVLFSDGTVAATGRSSSGQCNTSGWKDIVSISAGFLHSVGLKADGTVVAAGSAGAKRCDVDEWSNVIQVSAGYNCTVGLTADGTLLLASADSSNGDVSSMTDVIWVSAGTGSVTALRSNGSLLTTGSTPPDLSFVSGFEILTRIYGVQ